MSPLWLIVAFLLLQLINCKDLKKFPEGFQFGVATAAYQVEGAWNVSDKAESIWDRLTHTPGHIKDGATGDIADDSYNQYKRDVEMIKDLGVNYYRFSISWARLLPNGFANKISEDGKRYYNDLIDELIENNIMPMVTLYHWELPQKLQDLGGWANPLIVQWFEDYARVVFDLFSSKVKLWITINEPLMVCNFGYTESGLAPAIISPGIGEYMCVKNVLLAHAKAWRLFDKKYRPKWAGVMGIANQLIWMEPASNSSEDIQLAEEAHQFYTGIYSHPIYSTEGGWPKAVVDRVATLSAKEGYPRSRFPPLSQQEIELIRGTHDFYGLNYYTSLMVRRGHKSSFWSMTKDIAGGVEFFTDPAWKATVCGWFHVNPKGFRKMLNFVKERYNNPRVLITENGYPTNTGLNDNDRIKYFRDHLNELLKAIHEDGCHVTHYTAWSLMDNFEWLDGYASRFGLYEVDYEDPARTRRARKSAHIFKEIVRSKTVDPGYEPVLKDEL